MDVGCALTVMAVGQGGDGEWLLLLAGGAHRGALASESGHQRDLVGLDVGLLLLG